MHSLPFLTNHRSTIEVNCYLNKSGVIQDVMFVLQDLCNEFHYQIFFSSTAAGTFGWTPTGIYSISAWYFLHVVYCCHDDSTVRVLELSDPEGEEAPKISINESWKAHSDAVTAITNRFGNSMLITAG